MSSGENPLKFEDADTVLEEEEYEDISSIKELERTLESEGADLSPSRRQKVKGKLSQEEIGDLRAKNAYQQAQEDWWKLKRRNFNPEQGEAFPSDTVSYKGKKCDLYGYVHGDPIFKASERVLGSLNREVMESLGAGQHVVVEENLMRDLWLENSLHPLSGEMEDISLFKGSSSTNVLLQPLGTAALIGRSFLRRGKSAVGRFSSSINGDLSHTLDLARRNPAYMKDAKNAIEAISGPMEIKLDYRKTQPASDKKTLKRSAHQIETAIQKTPDKADKVNLVVGLGHVKEIQHYVENPESIEIDTI